jgi:glycosyltransferase involved in cell wall biosynthesis
VRVSIVVSTRNRSELLGATIESLLGQRSGNLWCEIIVVDNDSSDGTRAVIEDFAKRSRGIVRYVVERREGVSHGRNAGIAASRGSVIAFTDDDVRVGREWLATGARLLFRNRWMQYVGGPVLPLWAAEPPRWLTRGHWAPIAAMDHGGAPFEVPTARAVCLLTANLFIRRAALDRVGWFNPAFRRCQDHELMLRLWAAGLRGMYAPDVVARTIVPAERLTRGYHRRWHETHGEFLARMPLREHRVNNHVVVEPASTGRFFLGAPLFEYRALFTHLAKWARSSLARRAEDAFAHELRARYSRAFIMASMFRR